MDNPKVLVSTPDKRRWPKKRIIIAGLSIAVTGVAIFGVWWWQHDPKEESKPVTNTVLQQLREGRFNALDAENSKTLEKAVAGAASKQDKIVLLNTLAANAREQKRYREAVAALQQAYELGDTSSMTLSTIADINEVDLKDKKEALKYYRLALESSKKEGDSGTDPYAGEQASYLDSRIKALEAEGVQ